MLALLPSKSKTSYRPLDSHHPPLPPVSSSASSPLYTVLIDLLPPSHLDPEDPSSSGPPYPGLALFLLFLLIRRGGFGDSHPPHLLNSSSLSLSNHCILFCAFSKSVTISWHRWCRCPPMSVTAPPYHSNALTINEYATSKHKRPELYGCKFTEILFHLFSNSSSPSYYSRSASLTQPAGRCCHERQLRIMRRLVSPLFRVRICYRAAQRQRYGRFSQH